MQDNIKEYSKIKHRLAIINLILSPGILILFIIIGLPTFLKDITQSMSPNIYTSLLIFSMLIGIIFYLVTIPLGYYSGFVLEHKFSLSNQTVKAWIEKEIKKGAVSFIISMPLILCLYLFLKYHPLYWWLLTAILWFFISILVAKFAPILIVPLFYKYFPIKDESLKNRLIKLILKVGFKAKGVYSINLSKETKKANAALIGMGSQKRIVLCDTLLENFNEDEIEVVMGHELGHHKMKHILKTILFAGCITLLTFFITNIIFLKFHGILGYMYISDFESLVLIYAVISILNIFTLPIHNAFSRKLEVEADIFTLKITANKDAFISTMKKLARQNLADIAPGKFYEIMLYNHPPISRRIAFAESFKDKGIS